MRKLSYSRIITSNDLLLLCTFSHLNFEIMPTLEEYTTYVLGESLQQLNPDVLPKEIDVLRYFVNCYDVSQAEVSRMDKKKRNTAVVKVVAGAVEEIWKNKSLPVRSPNAIYLLVNRLTDRAEFIRVSKKNHEFDANWIQEVFQRHDKIFDIGEKPAAISQEEPMEVDLPDPVPEEEVLGKRKRKAPSRLGFDEVLITNAL